MPVFGFSSASPRMRKLCHIYKRKVVNSRGHPHVVVHADVRITRKCLLGLIDFNKILSVTGPQVGEQC